MEKNDRAALAVFDESAKMKKAERESQYGKIRIADIGVRNPGLKIKDVAFNTDSYFHPFKTYGEIIRSAKDDSIKTEADKLKAYSQNL